MGCQNAGFMPGNTGPRRIASGATCRGHDCHWSEGLPEVLAHIRDQHRLSLGSHGGPRMTEELNELGTRVGQRQVGRLMRRNGIRVIRSRKFKRTTDSDHAFNIAPNLLQQDFTAGGPNQKWAGDITSVWTRDGCILL
jgi:putative transposase